MKISNEVLISELIQKTKDHINQAESLRELSPTQLQWRPAEGEWSVLECLEHLNRYGDFYLPEIKKRLKANPDKSALHFKPGWLGNYFAQSMLPKQKLNKMKTFKSMNPIGSNLELQVIDIFIQQQKDMLDLLAQARTVNLTKIRTAISISKWIKLRLGDTLRVVIYHNERHMVQISNILNQQTVSV